MKLPQIFPLLSRATLGMPTGPETRATMPYDLLAGSWRGSLCPRATQSAHSEDDEAEAIFWKILKMMIFWQKIEFPIIVPLTPWATLRMPAGPLSRSVMPYGLLADLQRPCAAQSATVRMVKQKEYFGKSWEILIF